MQTDGVLIREKPTIRAHCIVQPSVLLGRQQVESGASNHVISRPGKSEKHIACRANDEVRLDLGYRFKPRSESLEIVYGRHMSSEQHRVRSSRSREADGSRSALVGASIEFATNN
jgi:hypothetical protein